MRIKYFTLILFFFLINSCESLEQMEDFSDEKSEESQQLQDFQCYNIPRQSLNGWYEGACTLSDGEVDNYLLIQKDTLTDVLLFYLNSEGLSVEDGFILSFLPDSTGQYFISTIYHSYEEYRVMYNDESVSILSFNNNEAVIFNVQYWNYTEQDTKSAPSLQGAVRHYLNLKRLPDFISLFGKINAIDKGNYGELIKSELEGILISPGKGWKASWIATAEVEILNFSMRSNYEKLKSGFMGKARAKVTNVKRTDNETIEVSVQLDNAQTIPDVLKSRNPDGSTGNPIKNRVLLGVAVGMDDHPGYYLNKWKSGLYEVNNSSSNFVFYLKIPISGVKTYYFRPYLIPYESAMADDYFFKNWLTLIRYGDSKSYVDFVINLFNFKQTGCSELPDNRYKISFTIDGEFEGDVDMNGLDWGFRINNDWNGIFASDDQYISPTSKHFEVEYVFQAGESCKEIQLTPFVFFRNSLPNFVFGEPITEPINLKNDLRDALEKFYYSTGGPNWKNNENWCTNKPISQWFGVYFHYDGTIQISLPNNNLTGEGNIADCSALVALDCSDNQLTNLNVATCTALERLNCYANQITSLDVSNCTALKILDCYENKITSLDVSKNTNLSTLDCSLNRLTSLNISGCHEIGDLYCAYNSITSLDVSGCKDLYRLYCYNNKLTSLNISGCTELERINCNNNRIKTLDLTGLTKLGVLCCKNNKITYLNLVDCINALLMFECENNCINQEITEDIDFTKKIVYEIHTGIDIYGKEMTWHTLSYDHKYYRYNGKYKANQYGWWHPGEPYN